MVYKPCFSLTPCTVVEHAKGHSFSIKLGWSVPYKIPGWHPDVTNNLWIHLLLLTKLWEHSSHLNFLVEASREALCLITWIIICDLWRNDFPHNSHKCFFTPSWICKWLCNVLAWEKLFSQYVHLKKNIYIGNCSNVLYFHWNITNLI